MGGGVYAHRCTHGGPPLGLISLCSVDLLFGPFLVINKSSQCKIPSVRKDLKEQQARMVG
jgi:hypothetical protein